MVMAGGGGGRWSLAAVAGGLIASTLVVLVLAVSTTVGAADEVWPPPPHAVVARNRPGDCRGVADAHCHGTIAEALKDVEAALPPPSPSLCEGGRQRRQRSHCKKHERLVILITAGMYEEQVIITRRNVVLLGEGRGNTIISGKLSNKTGTKMYQTATVTALAQGFLAQNLTIRNMAGPDGKQAVALRSNSNRTVVYGCSLEGYEDTLYAENGLQVYLHTDIYGTVDFIFGNAKAVFQNCRLRVREPVHGKHNVLTAQGCNNNTYSDSGFVFDKCKVEPDPYPNPLTNQTQSLTGVDTFLGRPHRNYSHVVFMNSELGALIHPDGWVPWDRAHIIWETTDNVKYIEYNNTGPGADTSRRVNWKGVSITKRAEDVTMYAMDNFVEGNKWIPEQIPYDHEVPHGIVGLGNGY